MIPHNRLSLGPEEEAAAVRVIHSGFVAPGKEVAAFENEFCAYLGLPERHAVMVSSGTAAIYLALWALGAHGKKVVFPAYVCSSLRHATALAGGIEVLVDNAPNSPHLDLNRVARRFGEIAIIPHLYGLPVDLSEIAGGEMELIEDCAQSLGATVNGVPVGLQGRIAVFSFHATKLITACGQGGMLASRDIKLIEAIRDYLNFDYRRDDRKRFNFLPGEAGAAVAREQLRKLPAFIKRRSEIFERYRRAGLTLLDIPVAASKNGGLVPVRYRAVMQTDRPRQIIESLGRQGVCAIVPIEDWEIMGGAEHFPHARKISESTVSLPIYPALTEPELDRVVEGLGSAVAEHG